MIQDEAHNYPLDYAIEEKDEKILRYLLTKQEIDDERKMKILTIIKKVGEKQ
ncbi:MAG: hypothetical protein AB7T03_02245 [Bacilli bacterium]